MDTAPDLPDPAPGQNGPATKAKRRHKPAVRYPYQVKINVTPALAASIERLARRLMMPEGILGRIALMEYCARQDPQYREE